MCLDLSVIPPGNAALRLGFFNDEPGLELLLQGEWDEAVYDQLRLRYKDLPPYLLRPISDQVVGTLQRVRDGAYQDLFAAAKAQYPFTVVDTSPVLDDRSVFESLRYRNTAES